MSDRGSADASERWFRLLLRLYPADFRDEMGAAVVEDYGQRARRARNRGTIALAGVWLAALIDSFRNGLGERVRPAISWRRSGNWGRDLEFARRRLVRAPLFVVSTIATLTVGLGTFAVVYAAVDKILLEPLPYPDPDDLYLIRERARDVGSVLTGPAIAELQKAGGVIERAVGFDTTTLTLPAGANTDAIRVIGVQTTPSLFDVLGIRPVLGRGFLPHETGPKSPNVVVLTDALWKRLGGDPAIIGSDITIGTTPFTIVGILPPEFRFGGAATALQPQAYIPLYVDLAAEAPYLHDYRGLIRARRGASREAVRAAVDRIGQLFKELDNHQGYGTGLFPVGLQADIVAEVRPALLALAFAVAFLLLILTVNLASLLLARAVERERELALSRALGASGAAIVRATLIEGALLGLAGGVAGAIVATWGTRLLVALGPDNLPRRDAIEMDFGAGLLVVVLGLLLGMAAAAAPGTWASRMPLESLVASSAIRSGTRTSTRMRRGLTVVQVALCLALLSAGGLVVRSFERLVSVDPGFEPAGVLTFNVGLGTWLFPEDADSLAFQDRLDAALRTLPGVTVVSATTTLPLAGGSNVRTISFPGAPGNTGDANHDVAVIDRIVTRSGYVEAIGMRVVAGRAFEAAHRPGVREALIDRQLAAEFYPNRSPIGASIDSEGTLLTIVGVVEQARLYTLHEEGRPQLFVRAEDYPGWRPANYVVRANGDPRTLIPAMETLIRTFERRLPVSSIQPMTEIVAARRSRERLSAVLISGLALGALLLVAMGLFGVIAGTVTRRRHELGLRLALGATHRQVLRLIMADGAVLVALGVLLGLPGVYAAGNLVRGLLIDISPWDPPTLLAVALGLALVAMAACYAPARRVLRIDPAPLLRQE